MGTKIFAVFIFSVASLCYLSATSTSICIDSIEEGKILNQFLKVGVEEEEYGYVLAGVKPVSIRGFCSLDGFPISSVKEISQREFMNTLLAQAAIPIWNKYCLQQENFSLKAVPLEDADAIVRGAEVRFVNVEKLKEVVEGNISLFRYILGPGATAEQIVNKIAYSKERLIDILQQDLTLMGIVLGFGSHSSLVGGRIETILFSFFSKDTPPFSPKSYFIQKKAFPYMDSLSPEGYAHYYLELAGGESNPFFDGAPPFVKVNANFPNLEKELLFLQSLETPLPPCLRESPPFIFGAFKGEEDIDAFFTRLKQVQAELQSLIKKPNFLSQVLETIGGKKPSIYFDEKALAQEPSLENVLNTKQWDHIFSEVAAQFEEKEAQEKFAYSLCHSTLPSPFPKTMFASKAILKGLDLALHNLESAKKYFQFLSQDAGPQGDVQEVFPQGLYFKTTLQGSGKKIKGAPVVQASYTVEDREGKIFFADYNAWIPIAQSIPGFAHGVQGMKVGEKRTLFIHPSLGYGVLTALPPCTSLLMKIDLINIKEGEVAENLPPLEPLDLSWIQAPSFRASIEESMRQRPELVGAFYREVLDKIKGLDRKALTRSLNKKLCSHQECHR